MQQTTKYKLDLIEKDDVFSPDALNENTQKLEAALDAETAARAAETAARQEADAALDARVTVLEAKKIVFGTYVGSATQTGMIQFVPLDFTPLAVIVQGEVKTQIAVLDQPASEITIGENGFTAIAHMHSTMNQHDYNYNFVAFG